MSGSSDRRAAVFLGPSLSHDEARAILPNADYYPPARQGDGYRVAASGIGAIILIDGEFHGVRSVWHHELVSAIDAGIEVIGAASMGALRATELHRYGMTGVGTIYGWYRRGVLNGDDEVALHHGAESSGYRAMSVPLVNIRYTLARMVAAGRLAPDVSRRLVRFAKQLYYGDRSYERLLTAPFLQRWSPAERSRLQRQLSTNRIDLKRLDAIQALRFWRDSRGRRRSPAAIGIDCRPPASSHDRALQTGFFSSRGVLEGRDVLRLAMRDRAWTRRMRRKLSRRAFIREWARLSQVPFPPIERQRIIDRGRAERGDRSVDELRANGLTPATYVSLLDDRALVEWLEDAGPRHFGLRGSFIGDWAVRSGVTRPVNWIVERTPCHFGLVWSFEKNLLEELQVTGLAAELVRSKGRR